MEMKKHSQWKRSEQNYIPPADGTIAGNLRVPG
jgi:hypothetical protein